MTNPKSHDVEAAYQRMMHLVGLRVLTDTELELLLDTVEALNTALCEGAELPSAWRNPTDWLTGAKHCPSCNTRLSLAVLMGVKGDRYVCSACHRFYTEDLTLIGKCF